MAAASMVAGCTTLREQPLTSGDMGNLSNKTVAVSRYAVPDFTAMTPTKAAFGILGAAAMISAGNSFVKDSNVPDPAEDIGQQLADALAGKYQIKTVTNIATPLSDDSVDEIAKHYASSDLVVDVKTVNWGYFYYPVNWASYRIMYTARMRLIDTQRKVVIAEGFCKRNPEKSEQMQGFDDMVANQGAWVKAILHGYAEGCVDELKQKTLLLAPATPVLMKQAKTEQ